ncbi:MAG: hypothetical protein E7Z96_07535 [Actinomycetaceae bacterium]|nr:hypothetical protein [Actinomycetaceae bacterium]
MRTFRALIRWSLVAVTIALSSWLFWSRPAVEVWNIFPGTVECDSLSIELRSGYGGTGEIMWTDTLERSRTRIDSDRADDMEQSLRIACTAARQGRTTLILSSLIVTGFIFVVLRSPLRDEDHPARRGSVGNYFFPDSTLRGAKPEDDAKPRETEKPEGSEKQSDENMNQRDDPTSDPPVS